LTTVIPVAIQIAFPVAFWIGFGLTIRPRGGINMARKTVLVCDNCGKEVDEGKGATMRLSFSDARRGAKEADLCDTCATGMPGRATARRGRKPKSIAA
jgi:hypothetical protein